MRLVFKAIRFSKERLLKVLSVIATWMQIAGNNITIHSSWIAYGIPDMITHGNGKITIGEKFKFNSGSHFNIIGRNKTLTFQVWGSLVIGNNVRMSGTAIICKNVVTIGNDVMIGGNVVIYDSDFHSLDHKKRNHDPEDRSDVKTLPVTIHDGAFIGAHTTILKGVTIGERSIIGLGSVVTGNIPADEIWAGNPAKFIRKTE
jgi:acetyltransferase-like isoleucine patch superfamily enzyme